MLLIPCIPELPSVPAFCSSYWTCMALLAVVKQANLILMPCQSYLRFESVMWLDLKENICKFLFFFPCQPLISHSVLPCTLLSGLFKMYQVLERDSRASCTSIPQTSGVLTCNELFWISASVASLVLSPADPCRRSQHSPDRASSGSLQTPLSHVLKHRGWSWTLRPGDILSFNLPHQGTAKILQRQHLCVKAVWNSTILSSDLRRSGKLSRLD